LNLIEEGIEAWERKSKNLNHWRNEMKNREESINFFVEWIRKTSSIYNKKIGNQIEIYMFDKLKDLGVTDEELKQTDWFKIDPYP